MTISESSIEKEIMKIQHKKTENNNYKNYLKNLSTLIKKIIFLIKNNKEKIKLLIPIAIISVLFMIYMLTKTIINIKELNKKSSELYNLNKYNTNILENNEYTKEDIKGLKTINELIGYEQNLLKDIDRYSQYLSNLQNPYENLINQLLLPQLNLWKDPFLGDIDINIVGAKFLEKNQYDDIKLIQKWSNFFKNVGNNNEFNQIEDIIIGDIIEEEELFHIPITIKFIANSKRSFLLLVEKLSITSNQINISLINEFMYNLRENIKIEKKDEIKKLINEINTGFSEDKIIGYHIYQRIFNNTDNLLIDDIIINKTIKKTIICDEDENDTYCYYKFRDKYRSIPSLAYTIGSDNNNDKTEDFKNFFKELPPIISINEFTFDRNMEQSISNYENIQYKGEIQMDIYGKGISDSEVEDISIILGNKCLSKNLTPDIALKKIENTIINIGSISQINTTKTTNLRELQTIIEKIKDNYGNLSNYKKIIELFELYRMLQDGHLCEN